MAPTRASHQGRPGLPGCSLPHRAGVGLKPQHFQAILNQKPDIGFFEIHAENYMVAGGPLHHFLERIRQAYPLSIHGVGLSIGGERSLDDEHLVRLAHLLKRYEPAVFSEHLAWSTHGGVFLNDLLPVAYNFDSLVRVCNHIDQIQDHLQRQILLENPSTYVGLANSTLSEGDFLHEVIQRTGCGLLLDVNNVYVSSINHGLDPLSALRAMPLDATQQIHIAGFKQDQDALGVPLLIDDHGSAVDAQVWELYRHVVLSQGALPTLLERDNRIPDDLNELITEALHAETISRELASDQRASRSRHASPAFRSVA